MVIILSHMQPYKTSSEDRVNLESRAEQTELGGQPFGPASRMEGPSASALNWVALRMLTGDRAKYVALVFAISFSSFLITQQTSIFAGLMNRTRSQILDVTDADIWVMDPATQYVDEVYALKIVISGGCAVSPVSGGRFRFSKVSHGRRPRMEHSA